MKWAANTVSKKYVTAKDPNTYMDLTDLIKVNKVTRYSKTSGKYVKVSGFSTKSEGTYKVQYKVKDKYSGTTYKTIKIKVVDSSRAVISGAEDRTVAAGETDAVKNVTAKQAGTDITAAIRVYIKAPESTEYTELTYEQAKAYVFEQAGEYSIRYAVSSTVEPYKETVREIKITAALG